MECKRHARVGNDRRNDSTSDNSNGRRGNCRRNRSNSDVSYDGRTGTATSRGRFACGGGRESERRHVHGGIMGKSTDGGLRGGPPPRRDFLCAV